MKKKREGDYIKIDYEELDGVEPLTDEELRKSGGVGSSNSGMHGLQMTEHLNQMVGLGNSVVGQLEGSAVAQILKDSTELSEFNVGPITESEVGRLVKETCAQDIAQGDLLGPAADQAGLMAKLEQQVVMQVEDQTGLSPAKEYFNSLVSQIDDGIHNDETTYQSQLSAASNAGLLSTVSVDTNSSAVSHEIVNDISNLLSSHSNLSPSEIIEAVKDSVEDRSGLTTSIVGGFVEQQLNKSYILDKQDNESIEVNQYFTISGNDVQGIASQIVGADGASVISSGERTQEIANLLADFDNQTGLGSAMSQLHEASKDESIALDIQDAQTVDLTPVVDAPGLAFRYTEDMIVEKLASDDGQIGS